VKRIASVLALTILLTGCATPEPATGRKSLFGLLTSDPTLPAELTTNVDVFPVANVRTPRHPLSFAPFRVAHLHTGWRREDSSETAMPLSRTGRVGQVSTTARQKYRFTLMEGDQPLWKSRCVWSGIRESATYTGKTTSLDITTSGELQLQCDFSKPAGERAWLLEWGMTAATQGLGMKFVSEGRLAGPSGEFRVTLLRLTDGSRVLGDIPAGYIFHSGAHAVAAASTLGSNVPGSFTISRSVSAEERSILAAAAAALLLNEQIVNIGED
jgi:hypothetical protein